MTVAQRHGEGRAPAAPAQSRPERWRNARNALFRQSRMLHAYLSAVAFLTLMFFSVTGILLNHPEWFRGTRRAAEERVVTLAPAELAAALRAPAPAEALAAAVGRHTALRGGFKSGELLGDEASLRLEGVTGTTDVTIDLRDGRAEVAIERATAVAVLNDLHRGKNAGAAWAAVIDVSAVLVLGLSLLGYILFFSLRFRLATSLKLTAVSLLALVGVFYVFVP